MFKSPIISGASSATRANGTAFWYTDPSTSTLTEISSNVGARSTKNPLYNVLKGLYPFDPNSGLGYLMFNDETPSGVTDNNRAHAKGFFVFDKNGGVYVEHSTPKFPLDPQTTSSYGFADSTKYGQSFMCVSIDFTNIESLAQAIIVLNPHVYSYYVPSWAATLSPSLDSLASGTGSSSLLQKAVDIKAGDTKLTYLAKAKKMGPRSL
jgi:deoxyribonuclease-2